MPKNTRTDRGRRPRNVHATHPIMRKGGVHEKSKKAKRSIAKRQLQKELPFSFIRRVLRYIGG